MPQDTRIQKYVAKLGGISKLSADMGVTIARGRNLLYAFPDRVVASKFCKKAEKKMSFFWEAHEIERIKERTGGLGRPPAGATITEDEKRVPAIRRVRKNEKNKPRKKVKAETATKKKVVKKKTVKKKATKKPVKGASSKEEAPVKKKATKKKLKKKKK